MRPSPDGGGGILFVSVAPWTEATTNLVKGRERPDSMALPFFSPGSALLSTDAWSTERLSDHVLVHASNMRSFESGALEDGKTPIFHPEVLWPVPLRGHEHLSTIDALTQQVTRSAVPCVKWERRCPAIQIWWMIRFWVSLWALGGESAAKHSFEITQTCFTKERSCISFVLPENGWVCRWLGIVSEQQQFPHPGSCILLHLQKNGGGTDEVEEERWSFFTLSTFQRTSQRTQLLQLVKQGEVFPVLSLVLLPEVEYLAVFQRGGGWLLMSSLRGEWTMYCFGSYYVPLQEQREQERRRWALRRLGGLPSPICRCRCPTIDCDLVGTLSSTLTYCA